MLTSDEWRARTQLWFQAAEDETTVVIKSRLARHALALTELADTIDHWAMLRGEAATAWTVAKSGRGPSQTPCQSTQHRAPTRVKDGTSGAFARTGDAR